MEKYYIDLTIYPKDIVEKALSDFSEVADFKLDGSDLFVCTKDDELSNDEIFNELGNYLIALINEN